ncbi:MAG: acetyl-CoA hydrolase/transferase C-terminal domain-containing protein [Bacteroidia bacterium]|nr:acetyl-CoA hydrolase/transferase C-terminal domain-containing protein [Bacteroidia bacterium]
MNLVSADLSFVSPAEAVACVRSGDRVFVHGAAMTPRLLVEALTDRDDLREVELVHIHTEGRTRYAEAPYASRFHANACFVGGNLRQAVQEGRADYIPVFLSEIPQLFRRHLLTPDVALIQVSPPDKHGYCSLGASVDVALAAVQTARRVVALVNPQVPRAHGDGFIHLSDIHAAVWTDEPIYAFPAATLTEAERQIGRQVAGLVEDGATLQMGIGGVPDAVLAELTGHRNLGIHTEMFSDGIIGLMKAGAVTNARKKVYPGKIVSSFVMGTQAVYDFLDDNPIVLLKDCSLTNDTSLIRKNPRVTAINSAIEIDLTGQICADTIGMSQYSGVGGQMDFIRGASLSEGGKPIIALSSVTSRGLSKIVPVLKPGAGVTTTRAHVHHVVTEYGVADLYGRNLRERAKALISIAHPDHREHLEQAAWERFGK